MAITAKSKSTSGKNKGKALDRPFAPAILRRAKEIVSQYQVVLWQEDGEWYGRGLELPGAMADGKTADRCVVNVRDAMTGVVAYHLERGEPVPAAANEARRTEQVNVRLTPAEKLTLEAAAHREGFQGISDFVRTKSLGRAISPEGLVFGKW